MAQLLDQNGVNCERSAALADPLQQTGQVSPDSVELLEVAGKGGDLVEVEEHRVLHLGSLDHQVDQFEDHLLELLELDVPLRIVLDPANLAEEISPEGQLHVAVRLTHLQ